MVTFRFYVVSTAAFFLALAVGVVVGSVLDGQIANSLQDRVEGLEESLDENVASIDAKNAQIDELEQFGAAVAPFALQNRLNESTAVVVAEQGVPAALVEDQVRQLRQAGASVEGIVWLQERWDLQDAADRSKVAEILGVEEDDPDTMRTAVWQQVLATAPVADPQPPSDPSVPAAEEPATSTTLSTPSTTLPPTGRFEHPVLADLAEAGLIRLQRIDGDNPAPGPNVVVVAATGTDSELAAPGALGLEVVRVAADAELPSVLAEAATTDDEGRIERATLINKALGEGPVEFSTVDDLDLLAGRVAVALALAEAPDGVVGRYGYGPNVDGLLPPIPTP